MQEPMRNPLSVLLEPRLVAEWLDEVQRHRRVAVSDESPTTPPTPTEPRHLLTLGEISKRLQVKPSWVYEKSRRGEIPHLKVGRYLRFRWADIERWLEEAQ